MDSRRGRPDMSALLEDSANRGSWSSCDCDGVMGDNNSTSVADDDPLTSNPVRAVHRGEDDESAAYPDDGGELSLSQNVDFNTTTTMSDNCNLFVPELVYNLETDDDRPPMPDLPVEALPVGSKVWVVDVGHVMVQLGDAWDHSIRLVCNGQAAGTIVRYMSPHLVFVSFRDTDNDLHYCHTLPRSCLSNTFVEAYPVPDGLEMEAAGSFGVGGLKPRAGGRGREKGSDDVNVLQQYCEVVDAGTPSQRTEAAWSMLLKRKYKDSIAELNTLYSKAEEEGQDVMTRNEILTWRSFAHFFNRDYDKSLADALRTIENSSSWVKGYVRAARAYTGLGKISRAVEMMNHASLLLPHSKEVTATLSMLQYLKKIQAQIDAYGLQYFLDQNYAKRLLTRRGFSAGEVLFEDDAIVVGCPSIENQGQCCDVCMSPTAKAVTFGTKKILLCSSRCEAVGRNFIGVETDVGSRSCDFAVQLMLNKAVKSVDLLSIERARLAMRLFYLAYYRHKRQVELDSKNNTGTVTSVRDVLAAVGVFPIPSCELDGKTKDDLDSLHSVITNFMTSEERAVYGRDLLVLSYNYVVNYAVHITGSDAAGKPISGYLVANVGSCVERADVSQSPPSPTAANSTTSCNAEVRLSGFGKVSIVALTAITSGERLTIRGLRKGRAV